MGHDSATQTVRDAAFLAKGLVVQVVFPDGTSAEGPFNITDYEVYAETGE